MVAADAWTVGAIIYNAATLDFLIPDGPKKECHDTETIDPQELRRAFVFGGHER